MVSYGSIRFWAAPPQVSEVVGAESLKQTQVLARTEGQP